MKDLKLTNNELIVLESLIKNSSKSTGKYDLEKVMKQLNKTARSLGSTMSSMSSYKGLVDKENQVVTSKGVEVYEARKSKIKLPADHSDRKNWFVLYSAGADRNNYYGWIVLPKDDYTKPQARKIGDRMSERLGGDHFSMYFTSGVEYVTDSIDAFEKRCKKMDFNPNLDPYRTK